MDEVGEGRQVVLGALGLAVAVLDAAQLVGVLGDEDGRDGALALAVEDLAQARVAREPGGDVGQRQAAQVLDEDGRVHTGAGLEVAGGRLAQVAPLALELGDELVAHQGTGLVVADLGQLRGELGEADRPGPPPPGACR